MVRLGIFRGKGRILFKAARFQKDYWLLENSKVNLFCLRLTTQLKTLPHGPFNALKMVLGLKGAIMVASRGDECEIPPNILNQLPFPPAASSTLKGTFKRIRLSEVDDDDEGEVFVFSDDDEPASVPGPSQRRRIQDLSITN
jgi:hypothetical protein